LTKRVGRRISSLDAGEKQNYDLLQEKKERKASCYLKEKEEAVLRPGRGNDGLFLTDFLSIKGEGGAEGLRGAEQALKKKKDARLCYMPHHVTGLKPSNKKRTRSLLVKRRAVERRKR